MVNVAPEAPSGQMEAARRMLCREQRNRDEEEARGASQGKGVARESRREVRGLAGQIKSCARLERGHLGLLRDAVAAEDWRTTGREERQSVASRDFCCREGVSATTLVVSDPRTTFRVQAKRMTCLRVCSLFMYSSV
ncbi:hypothetical protein TrVGV298_011925 [Trichoderma virens]|nr:hypothetical protein TrVGV298_011925 [Trichoderma virens]